MVAGTLMLRAAIHSRHKSLKKEVGNRPDAMNEQTYGHLPLPVVPKITDWKQAIEQWERGNRKHGLTVSPS